ncbi:hypothetical protein AQI95_32670 [Streptomyces yokosukanensis]|uniref:Dipeptidylpeptidase IV N-terminal domain-containing protein n=1 Tax=Streptomyces yokosukanensis TaxID=67386 RepID=A0A101NXT0_9ACTN|nr:hypothetical protein AQI95_32670 [Streptomyces yokosukanensis]
MAAAGLVAGARARAQATTDAAVPDGSGVRAARTGRVLTYTRTTGGSVTGCRGGGALIAEVQEVLWRVPRAGGRAVQVTGWELEATRPALSPDGTSLAVCGCRGGGFHLWTLRPDGSGPRRLTDGPWDDRGVAWSPDGTRLAFSSERGGDAVAGACYGLWVLDRAGGRPRRVTGGDHEDFDPAWSADGRSLVCVRAAHTPGGGNDGGRSLVRVPLSGGPAEVLRTVAGGRLTGPSVSPSGRIAYVHLTGTGAPGSAVLYVGDVRIRVRSVSSTATPTPARPPTAPGRASPRSRTASTTSACLGRSAVRRGPPLGGGRLRGAARPPAARLRRTRRRRAPRTAWAAPIAPATVSGVRSGAPPPWTSTS